MLSESFVPKDLNILLNLIMFGYFVRHFLAQLGVLGGIIFFVMYLVKLCTVRSDSLSCFESMVGGIHSGYHPSLRGNAVVIGPMMAGGLALSFSYMCWRSSLSYEGWGMVGVSSHMSTGRISSSGVGW